MSEDIQKLKEIGAEKIHADTHIALGHITAIFNEDFGALNRVQFLGFVSILEREYHLELDDLKNQVESHYVDQPMIVGKSKTVFTTPEKSSGIKSIYVVAVLVLFIVIAIAILSFNYTSQENQEHKDTKKEHKVEKVQERGDLKVNTNIENEYKSASSLLEQREHSTVELNDSIETEEVNQTQLQEKKVEPLRVPQDEIKKEKKKRDLPVMTNMEVKKLVISPRSKVWIGYIDLKTRKKSQKVIRRSITLRDDYIIVLGHSYVRLRVDDKKYTYKTKGNLYLLFKNGKLTRIPADEFKRLNRGHKW